MAVGRDSWVRADLSLVKHVEVQVELDASIGSRRRSPQLPLHHLVLDSASPYVLMDADFARAHQVYPAQGAGAKPPPRPIGLGGTTFVVVAQTRVRHVITAEDGRDSVRICINGADTLLVQGLMQRLEVQCVWGTSLLNAASSQGINVATEVVASGVVSIVMGNKAKRPTSTSATRPWLQQLVFTSYDHNDTSYGHLQPALMVTPVHSAGSAGVGGEVQPALQQQQQLWPCTRRPSLRNIMHGASGGAGALWC
jgi:hypothetical protein